MLFYTAYQHSKPFSSDTLLIYFPLSIIFSLIHLRTLANMRDKNSKNPHIPTTPIPYMQEPIILFIYVFTLSFEWIMELIPKHVHNDYLDIRYTNVISLNNYNLLFLEK